MPDIVDCISFLTSTAAKSMARLARDGLGAYNVTPVQYAVMRSLLEKDSQTGAEISAKLLIDSATLTGVIDRLERIGLIARTSDPHDRRVNRLALTNAGRDLMPALDAVIAAVNAEADRRMGRSAAMLRTVLKRLANEA